MCAFSTAGNAKVALLGNVEVVAQEFIVETDSIDLLDDLLPMERARKIAHNTWAIRVSPTALSALGVEGGYTSQALSLMSALAAVDGVKHVEPNYLFYSVDQNSSKFEGEAAPTHHPVYPNDPYLRDQWYLERTNVPEAWSYTQGSADVVVAVTDSGIAFGHTDLRENLFVEYRNGYPIYGYNAFERNYRAHDDHGHGTTVAGVIGARANNGWGVAGVNWSTSLMSVKVLDAGGAGSVESVIEGIYWAVDHGARVINASWGGGSYSRALEAAIRYANDRDVLFVAVTGNSHSAVANYPAAYDIPNVIAVAGTNEYDELVYWSGGRDQIDIAAPGSNIVTSGIRGDLVRVHGGSYATAQVTAAIALALAYQPNCSAIELKEKLFESADHLRSLRSFVGNDGARLNVGRFLESL